MLGEGLCLITGAGSGIGRATALAAEAAGAEHLLLIDRNGEALRQTAGMISMSGCDWAAMDVADPAAWETLDIPMPITSAVICAGVSDSALIADMAFEDWRKVLGVNLDGAFLTLQATLRGAADGASIVAVSSATGHKAAPMTAAYGASKAGLSQLVKVAALEGAARKIRVNAVAPGGVKTPMFSDQDFFEDFKAEHGGEDEAWTVLGASAPLGRFAEATEIADLILFLLGPKSATMTGAILTCDGGYGL